jgi:hypothetical protein
MPGIQQSRDFAGRGGNPIADRFYRNDLPRTPGESLRNSRCLRTRRLPEDRLTRAPPLAARTHRPVAPRLHRRMYRLLFSETGDEEVPT